MPDNSLADRPYPSDPVTRYRKGRRGQPANPAPANAVWTLTCNATGGAAIMGVGNPNSVATIKHNFSVANEGLINPTFSAAQYQAFLENLVGVGNVTVTGGPGAAGGGTPYVITFGGELAGEPIWVSADFGFVSGGGATGTIVNTVPGGVASPSVPIGPTASTNTQLPSNSPRGREEEAIFP